MLQPTKISLFGFDPGSGLADQLQGIRVVLLLATSGTVLAEVVP